MSNLKVDDLSLEDYGISKTTGFLIERPLETLPKYFEPWNRLAKSMPKYVNAKIFRDEVNKMPLLHDTKLIGHRSLRLAHLQLSIIGAGYVWQDGDEGAAVSVPECLAIPWYNVSQKLGVQPILSHPSFCLANWKKIDVEKPLSLLNMKALYNVPGGEDCDWFAVVTCATELAFTDAFQPILDILKGAESGDVGMMILGLDTVTSVITKLQETVSKMHDRLDAGIFYNTIRPFLSGWGGESNPLPDGLIYEGVENNQPLKMIGGSAAQSGILQLLDVVLGIEHAQDKKEFLDKMRKYMIPSHCQFILDVESLPNNVHSCVKSTSDEELKEQYNMCVTALTKFRSYHINLVTKYIVISSKKHASDNQYKSLTQKGTGGTNLLPFLRELRADTETAVL